MAKDSDPRQQRPQPSVGGNQGQQRPSQPGQPPTVVTPQHTEGGGFSGGSNITPVLPPPPAPNLPTPPYNAPTVAPSWDQQAYEYLVSRGWERLGTNERGVGVWADPMGQGNQKAVKKPSVKLPVAGGGEEIIQQWHCPPVMWNCTTEEAMVRQKERDKAAQGEQPRGELIGRSEKNQPILSSPGGEALAEVIARKKKELAVLEAMTAGVMPPLPEDKNPAA